MPRSSRSATAPAGLYCRSPWSKKGAGGAVLLQFRNAVGAVSDLIRAVIDHPYNKSFGVGPSFSGILQAGSHEGTIFAFLPLRLIPVLPHASILELKAMRSIVSKFPKTSGCATAAVVLVAAACVWTEEATARQTGDAAGATIPRTADGRPDFQGIWQVRNRASYNLEDHAAGYGMPPGRSVVDGGEFPIWRTQSNKGTRTSGTGKPPTPFHSATCPAFRASCTWSIRFRFFKPPATLR